MFRQILMPLDGSEFAARALPVAAGLARRTGARLHLASVHQRRAATMISAGITPDVIEAYGELDRLNRQALADSLEHSRSMVERKSLVVETALLENGRSATEQLIGYADAHAIDLIVMTTHGRGAIGRLVMGSVADGLLRLGGRPCLVIGADAAAGESARGEAGFAHVLVPLDGTPEAEHAVDVALELVESDRAELILLQVVVPPRWFAPALPSNSVAWVQEVVTTTERHAGAYLETLAARLRLRGMRARPVVRVAESPAAAILDMLDEGDADLLAISGPERGGAERLLLGSVIDKAVRRAPVPVLVSRVPALAHAREAYVTDGVPSLSTA